MPVVFAVQNQKKGGKGMTRCMERDRQSRPMAGNGARTGRNRSRGGKSGSAGEEGQNRGKRGFSGVSTGFQHGGKRPKRGRRA